MNDIYEINLKSDITPFTRSGEFGTVSPESGTIVTDAAIYASMGQLTDLSDNLLNTLFAKSRTIEARMSETTTLLHLVELVEKYVLSDEFRVVVFWAELIEWAYLRNLPDISDVAEMNYKCAKHWFMTDQSKLCWLSVKRSLRSLPGKPPTH